MVRNGTNRHIPARDILVFEVGDKLAADGRLVEAAGLEIEEAALTGDQCRQTNLLPSCVLKNVHLLTEKIWFMPVQVLPGDAAKQSYVLQV